MYSIVLSLFCFFWRKNSCVSLKLDVSALDPRQPAAETMHGAKDRGVHTSTGQRQHHMMKQISNSKVDVPFQWRLSAQPRYSRSARRFVHQLFVYSFLNSIMCTLNLFKCVLDKICLVCVTFRNDGTSRRFVLYTQFF